MADEIRVGIDWGVKDGDKSVLCVQKNGNAHFYELVELHGYKPGDIWLSREEAEQILEGLQAYIWDCDWNAVELLKRKMGKT